MGCGTSTAADMLVAEPAGVVPGAIAPQSHRDRAATKINPPMIIHAGPLPSKERVEKLECYLQLEHAGVTCDGCGCAPIIGLRYARAGKDYDLCGKCFDGQRADEQVNLGINPIVTSENSD